MCAQERLPPTVCYHRCVCGQCGGQACGRCGQPIPANQPPPRKRRRVAMVLRDGPLADAAEACVSSLMPVVVRKEHADDVTAPGVYWTEEDTNVEGRRLRGGMLSFSSADWGDHTGVARRRRALMSAVAHRVTERLLDTGELPVGDDMADAAVAGRVLVMGRASDGVLDVRMATPSECRSLAGEAALGRKK